MLNELMKSNLSLDQMSYVIYNHLVDTETSGKQEEYNMEEIN